MRQEAGSKDALTIEMQSLPWLLSADIKTVFNAWKTLIMLRERTLLCSKRTNRQQRNVM